MVIGTGLFYYKVMRVIVWLAVIVILGALSIQLYHLYKNNGSLEAKLNEAERETAALAHEAQLLKSDIGYFSESENLAKELKSKFDYKKPGEKLIKIQ